MLSWIRALGNILEKIPLSIYLSILFLIFFGYGLWNYNYTTAHGDLAEFVNNPLRVMNGEMPYRDFTYPRISKNELF